MQNVATEGLARIERLLEPDEALMEYEIARETHFTGRIFSAHELEVELSDGSHASREIVEHHGGAGVVAVCDGLVCLVRQYRIALGQMTLEIPAGKLEEGEDPADAAARELEEETGLSAESLELVARAWGSPGFTSECTYVFVARGLKQGQSHPDEGEFVCRVWLPVDDVVAAVRAGLIRDAKTIVGVFAVAGNLA